MSKYDVVIIGAGISGLCAAIHLQNEGLSVKILEASDDVGGRVRTDKVDGFLLDRGFQVLLTAYPEVQKMLDEDLLGLKNFFSGSIVYHNNKRHILADPFRQPIASIGGFFAPFLNFGDKLKILALRNRHKRLSVEQIFSEPEQSTLSYLKEWNFSEAAIQAFFKPFLGGIFLDHELKTSSRLFEFVFKMFGRGHAALPINGISAIPRQLASQLQQDTALLNTKVVALKEGAVVLENGEEINTKKVLIATAAPVIKSLIPDYNVATDMQQVRCLYFATDKNPIVLPRIMLNGEGTGLVNNLCVPSVVQPSYAPPGKHLISVSVIQPTPLSDEELLMEVQKELRKWFKKEVRYWEHLKTYTIPHALPQNYSINLPDKNNITSIRPNVYVCGDHTHYAALNGAMESARHVSNVISWDLALGKE